VVTDRIILRGGPDTAELLRTAARVVAAGAGQIAIIGGLAVTCRLTYAHRATTDVNTVAEERTPTVIEVLVHLGGAVKDPNHRDRLVIDGVPVDVIATIPVDRVDLPEGVGALFVLSHRFALESADVAVIALDGPVRVEVQLPIATPAGLVATKLCGVQGLTRRPPEKKATDGYDLYRLLRELDNEGEIAAALREQGDPLLGSVHDAATDVLLRGGAGVVRNIAIYGGAGLPGLTVDELALVAERFVDNLEAI
jgi:hypothetical protein